MKRTKQSREQDRRSGHMPVRLTQADLARVVGGDLYMQNPRGSNDRLGSGG
ncbi:MAG TPA: hypothetical protein VF469_17180 [Kofleriaceae bacterium]